jgi:flavodoxin
MKKLIIYSSDHKGNTEKVAMAMAEALRADLVKVQGLDPGILDGYDMIGFGSGLYGGRPSPDLAGFIESLDDGRSKKAFAFFTCGFEGSKRNTVLKKMLEGKGFEVLGSFACRGFTDYGPFKLIGGISKGKPDDRDILDAKNFVLRFIEYA